jgi:surface carbohydrate biosynthesis protein
MASPSTLLLPVESQVRELDGKLLLACAAAERGLPVVLGERYQLDYHVHELPRGVYLSKGGRSRKRFVKILRGLGHQIAMLDEEALARVADDEFARTRLVPNKLRHLSHCFAWGEDDADLIRSRLRSLEVPVHVTGNPRIDLTRPELRGFYEPEVNALRRRFGDFILITSNFAGLNHFLPGLAEQRILAERPDAIKASEYYRALSAQRLRVFESFVAMIPTLASAFPKHAIVVRPHPSEDPARWQSAASGHANVKVVHEGNIIPWLIAARASVANSCTTLVEAYLLGAIGLHFEPIDESLDFSLPRCVSHRCASPAALTDSLALALAGKLAPRDDAEARRITHHVTALDGDLASDRIVGALIDAGYAREMPPQPGKISRSLATWRNRTRAGEKAKGAARQDSVHDPRYHAHRFPELSVADVEARVKRFSLLTGRFGEVRVRSIARHLFAIDRAS